jgi:diguanylate cyclase (GGDEF)-like protein
LTGYEIEPEGTQLLSQLVHLARLAGRIFFSPKGGMAIRDFKTVSNRLFEMGPDQVDSFFRSIKEEALDAAQQYGFDISHLRSYTEILDEANQELTELNVTYERMNRELEKAKKEAEELSRKLRKANEILQELANVDDLTGLYNRRYHDDYLKREFERSKRYQRPFSYTLIDIDHFKSVNDNYGHQQGDMILKELGSRLRTMIRSSDMAFRYGGEEIAVVLPETDLDGAKTIGERILKDIERHEFPRKPGEPMHITVSLGLASYGESDEFETLHELVKQADECLYRAKKEGRNRMCF